MNILHVYRWWVYALIALILISWAPVVALGIWIWRIHTAH